MYGARLRTFARVASMARTKTEADLEARDTRRPEVGISLASLFIYSTGVSFCGDVGVAPELRGSGRIRDPNQVIPMIKMVIMAQIHMKIFRPFDRPIRETHCLKLIVINLFR